MRTGPTLSTLIAAAILTATPAWAAPPPGGPDVMDRSVTAPSGERVLRQSVMLAAPRAAVWRMFSSSEGLRQWEAPAASIDLRIGGLMQASHQPGAVLGDDSTIVNEIVAYVPEELLVFRNIRTPKDFPWPERFSRVRSVVQLERIDDGHTRLTISGVGYGAQDQALYEFFRSGNAYLLQVIKARLEGRPSPTGTAH